MVALTRSPEKFQVSDVLSKMVNDCMNEEFTFYCKRTAGYPSDCDYCGESFNPRIKLNRHIATIHEETTTPGSGAFSGMIWKIISAWKHGSYVIIQITLM